MPFTLFYSNTQKHSSASAVVFPSLKQDLKLAQCSNHDILTKCVNSVSYKHDNG